MSKYCLEFGVRGGAHTDNVVIPTRALAEKLARCLVMTFKNDPHATGATARDWVMGKHCARQTWQSSKHFVSITRLDGGARGPAAAGLWRKPSGPELMPDLVIDHY